MLGQTGSEGSTGLRSLAICREYRRRRLRKRKKVRHSMRTAAITRCGLDWRFPEDHPWFCGLGWLFFLLVSFVFCFFPFRFPPFFFFLERDCLLCAICDTWLRAWEEVISDNGRPFQSQQCEAFARKWNISPSHDKSLYHSQANGLVESAVKTAKSLLRTAIKAVEDPSLVGHSRVLKHSDAGNGHITSPATHEPPNKTLLPMDEKHLEAAVTVSTDSVQLQQRLHNQKEHRDQSHGTKELPELNSGDIVRVRPMLVGQQEWEEAIVVEKHSEPRLL